MNKQEVAQRLGMLRAEMERAKLHHDSLQSQVKECGYWLGRLEASEPNQFADGFQIDLMAN